jgi:hypothetical protein
MGSLARFSFVWLGSAGWLFVCLNSWLGRERGCRLVFFFGVLHYPRGLGGIMDGCQEGGKGAWGRVVFVLLAIGGWVAEDGRFRVIAVWQSGWLGWFAWVERMGMFVLLDFYIEGMCFTCVFVVLCLLCV